MASQALWLLLGLMEAAIIGMYQMGQVSELSLKISVVGVFVYCLVVLIYEIFGQSQDETERERRLNILGNVRLLTAAAATNIMLLIIVPPIGWALLPLAIMLVLKIAFNLERSFIDFGMVMHRNNTSDPSSVVSNKMEDGREQQQLSLPPSTHDSGGVMHQNNTSDPIPLASNNLEDGTEDNTEERAEEEQLAPSTELVLTIEDKQESFFDFGMVMHPNNTSDPSSVVSNNMEDGTEEQQLSPSPSTNDPASLLHQNPEVVVTIEDDTQESAFTILKSDGRMPKNGEY